MMKKDSPQDDRLEYYRKLNDEEKKLREFKDDDQALRLKLLQLAIINKSRKKFKAAPVELDILASRVANKACREAAENKYISHWNLAGEKPYIRYGLAGGCDHVSENVYGEWTTGGYNISPSVISDLMNKGHSSFMAEHAPDNGHKKNVIDKQHNFVGIGFFITRDQFRYNEEFINRYLNFERIPAGLKVNEVGDIAFKSRDENFPYYLIIFREPFPTPLRPSQLNRKGSYPDYTDQKYEEMPAWDIEHLKSGDTYHIPLKFKTAGLYYIQIFTSCDEITSPKKLNTKGKTVSSGIVIRVDK